MYPLFENPQKNRAGCYVISLSPNFAPHAPLDVSVGMIAFSFKRYHGPRERLASAFSGRLEQYSLGFYCMFVQLSTLATTVALACQV